MRRDCFAYDKKNDECKALVSNKCEKCRFFKTERQIIIAQEEAYERLANMAKDGDHIPRID